MPPPQEKSSACPTENNVCNRPGGGSGGLCPQLLCCPRSQVAARLPRRPQACRSARCLRAAGKGRDAGRCVQRVFPLRLRACRPAGRGVAQVARHAARA